MTEEQTPNPQDDQQAPPDPTKEHVDPATNPGPPGNPETESDAVEKGQEKLDRTLPY
jgi:hypothetical protein